VTQEFSIADLNGDIPEVDSKGSLSSKGGPVVILLPIQDLVLGMILEMKEVKA
jgi:hypothetical protein